MLSLAQILQPGMMGCHTLMWEWDRVGHSPPSSPSSHACTGCSPQHCSPCDTCSVGSSHQESARIPGVLCSWGLLLLLQGFYKRNFHGLNNKVFLWAGHVLFSTAHFSTTRNLEDFFNGRLIWLWRQKCEMVADIVGQ